MRKLATFFATFVAAVIPFWMLPLSPNPIGYQKQYLLFALGIVLFSLWALQSFRQRRVHFSFSALTLGAVAIGATALLSAALSVNAPQQIFGRAMLSWSLALVVIFGTTLQVELRWSRLLRFFLWAGAGLSLLTWLQFAPWNAAALINRVFTTSFPSTLAFSPAESLLALCTFLLPTTIAGLVQVMTSSDSDKKANGPKLLMVLRHPLTWIAVNAATLVAVAVAMIRQPSLRPILLPFSTGWGIAVENFKAVQTLLLGVGPESFLMTFHRFRPVDYNMSTLWSTRFSTSSSEALQTLTTTGLLGILAWLFFFGALLVAVKTLWNHERSLGVFAALAALFFFLVPMSALGYAVLTLLALAVTAELRHHQPHRLRDIIVLLSAIRIVPRGEISTLKSQTPFTLATLMLLVAIVALTTFTAGKHYLSQAAYTLSLHAAQRNKVTETYQLQQLAVRLNPSSTALHRAYAATNLAIARSLSENDDLGEEERKLFAQLLQQAIREGRTAAQLLPQETENWETLASIYSNLLNVEGAKDWATAALIQAIQTDPVSPQLRANLGSVYLTLNQPDEALRLFEQAIQLKPDWSAGYIGFGRVLSGKEQWNLAQQAYKRALELSEAGTEEYAGIQQLLAEAEGKAQNSSSPESASELPNPGSSPSLPEQPAASPLPSEFEPLIHEEPAASPAPTSDQSNGNNIVLPQDVGF